MAGFLSLCGALHHPGLTVRTVSKCKAVYWFQHTPNVILNAAVTHVIIVSIKVGSHDGKSVLCFKAVLSLVFQAEFKSWMKRRLKQVPLMDAKFFFFVSFFCKLTVLANIKATRLCLHRLEHFTLHYQIKKSYYEESSLREPGEHVHCDISFPMWATAYIQRGLLWKIKLFFPFKKSPNYLKLTWFWRPPSVSMSYLSPRPAKQCKIKGTERSRFSWWSWMFLVTAAGPISFVLCCPFAGSAQVVAHCLLLCWRSGPSGDVVCQVFSEYARACGHADHPLHDWRQHVPHCGMFSCLSASSNVCIQSELKTISVQWN